MKVRIYDLSQRDALDNPLTYEARTIENCLDETDKRVFDLVLEFDDVITMGKVIGEPVR